MNKNQQTLYECQECNLKYKNQKWAKKCEEWCKKYHSCNLEIIKYAEKTKNN